jgi:hypothetical protein
MKKRLLAFAFLFFCLQSAAPTQTPPPRSATATDEAEAAAAADLITRKPPDASNTNGAQEGPSNSSQFLATELITAVGDLSSTKHSLVTKINSFLGRF